LSSLELELERSTPAWCVLGQQIGEPAVERFSERGKGRDFGLPLAGLDQ
jgi:hypothetical protein